MNRRFKLILASMLCTAAIPSVAFASSSGRTASSVVPQYITIQPGDTLWDLSSKYGVSVSRLEQWNGLTDHSTLQIGHKLVIGWTKTGALATAAVGKRLSSRDGAASDSLADGVFGERVAQYAEQFVGAPYRWGGNSASGFDCSGLVQFTFAHFGISLGRSSYDQYQQGVPVSQSNLVPGDLVFFDAYGPGASHVGIYLGGGRFVNAASGGVRIDSLSESYWANHYIGARRVH